MDRTRIVIIDSGVTNVHSRIENDVINGIGIKSIGKDIFVSDDISDWADHGTGIYGIIKSHDINADIFVIRIGDSDKHKSDISELLFALDYVYNNVSCDLVNSCL